MRYRKAFLSLAVVAAAGLLAATPGLADDLSCSTGTGGYGTGGYTVTVSKPPQPVKCEPSFSPDPNGACTGIEYTVSKHVSHF
jgi:hypothetical protein